MDDHNRESYDRPPSKAQPRYKSALLHEMVHESISSAQEQVQRSRRLVADSHQIIARTKLSLARSIRIQQGGETDSVDSKNPLIVPDSGAKTDGR